MSEYIYAGNETVGVGNTPQQAKRAYQELCLRKPINPQFKTIDEMHVTEGGDVVATADTDARGGLL